MRSEELGIWLCLPERHPDRVSVAADSHGFENSKVPQLVVSSE